MKKEGVSACVIPTNDPHLSEYTCRHFKLREWLSGFTGSNGTLVVTMNKAGLWTDGRYYIQAEKELSGTGITLFKASEKETQKISDFIIENVPKSSLVGLDGTLFSKRELDNLKQKLKENEIIIKTRFDASVLWENKPPMPSEKAFLLEDRFSGESAEEKIKRLRITLKGNEVDFYATALSDSVMWLLNIRGGDILYTPVMLSYLFVSGSRVILFAQKEKVSEISGYLEGIGVEVCDYSAFYEFLASLDKEKRMAVDFDKSNYEMVNSASCHIVNKPDFIENLKAIKNETEISNIKKAYIKENIALLKSFFEIYNTKEEIDECDVRDIIEKNRKKQKGYLYPSFETIAAYGINAAMMHYSPQKDKCAIIKKEEMLLIDTGAQYREGTTDTTRTLVFKMPNKEIRRLYTLCLKGNINLSKAIFKENTKGSELDILARGPLLKEKKDYRCSTGHGVGYLLCVHEGPQRISPSSSVILKPYMTVTNEPGVYEENKFGIRIENHLAVVLKGESEYGKFLGFEVLNYCPIGTNVLLPELLNEEERAFLNSYNKKCQSLYKKNLTQEEYKWLINYTKEI